MNVYRKTVARSRYNFAVETQQCVLCIVEIDVSVNYVKLFSDAQQCLLANLSLATMQNYMYLPVF
jgi:hypothetical protein